MIVFIIISVVFAVGMGFSMYQKKVNGSVSTWALGMLLVGSFCLMVNAVIFIAKPFERDRFMIRYEQEMLYLLRCEQNPHLTGEEIVQASEMIIRTNIEINNNWKYYKDPWIGVYFDGQIAKLPTFDVRTIPVAHILQDLEVGMQFTYGEDWVEKFKE